VLLPLNYRYPAKAGASHRRKAQLNPLLSFGLILQTQTRRVHLTPWTGRTAVAVLIYAAICATMPQGEGQDSRKCATLNHALAGVMSHA
jgi:hypothetical protein